MTVRILICSTLLLTSGVSYAADRLVAPAQHFDGIITDTIGLRGMGVNDQIPVSITIVKREFQHTGQLGGNRATLNLTDGSSCEGEIDISTFETTTKPPIGSEGNYRFQCTSGLFFQGNLKEKGIPTDGNFSSVWSATGTSQTVVLYPDKDPRARLKPEVKNIKFVLKIRRR